MARRDGVHRRLDTKRYRLGTEENQSTDDGPKEHSPRVCNGPGLTLRGDELVPDEDEHEDDDNSPNSYDELQNILKEGLEIGPSLERVDEGGAGVNTTR